MTYILMALVVILVLAASAFITNRVTLYRMLRQRYAVVLKSGRTIAGVLCFRRGGMLCFADVAITENGDQVRIDGDVYVERTEVMWLQRLS